MSDDGVGVLEEQGQEGAGRGPGGRRAPRRRNRSGQGGRPSEGEAERSREASVDGSMNVETSVVGRPSVVGSINVETGTPEVEKVWTLSMKRPGSTCSIREEIDLDHFKLPPSIWSAALLTLLMFPFPWTTRSDAPGLPSRAALFKDFFHYTMPSLLNCIVCTVVEIAFIIYAKGVVDDMDMDGAACQSPAGIDYLCVGCLVLVVWSGDVNDTFAILSWLRQIPHDNTPADARPFGFIKMKNGPTGLLRWRPGFGMSMGLRMLLLLGFFVRLALAVALVVVGSGHIVGTESTDEKILNAVAMAFVLDLDDFAYHFCVSHLVSVLIEYKLPEIHELPSSSPSFRQSFFEYVEYFEGYIYPAFAIIFTCCLVQPSCSDYGFVVSLALGVPLLLVSCSCFCLGMWDSDGNEHVAEFGREAFGNRVTGEVVGASSE